MKDLPEGVPADAEHHIRSDFITHQKGAVSKLIPGKRLPDVEEFFCPSCGIDNPPPEHSVHATCRRCEMAWVSYGNSIYLWKRKPPLKVVV